jgi:catechol 2,3-dioxygenase-like lactoylglutathione lyase family enzyme
MGFQLIGNKIHEIRRSETPDAAVFGIYPQSLNNVKIAYMSTGNGVGFEIFEFTNPSHTQPERSFEYNRGGFFHVCVTDHDPESLVERVVVEGGSRVGKLVRLVDGIKCVYVADPWGNILEILDTSFERLATASA